MYVHTTNINFIIKILVQQQQQAFQKLVSNIYQRWQSAPLREKSTWLSFLTQIKV